MRKAGMREVSTSTTHQEAPGRRQSFHEWLQTARFCFPVKQQVTGCRPPAFSLPPHHHSPAGSPPIALFLRSGSNPPSPHNSGESVEGHRRSQPTPSTPRNADILQSIMSWRSWLWPFSSPALSAVERNTIIAEYSERITQSQHALASAQTAWNRARKEAGDASEAGNDTQAKSILAAAQEHKAAILTQTRIHGVLTATREQLAVQRDKAEIEETIKQANKTLREWNVAASLANTPQEVGEFGETLAVARGLQTQFEREFEQLGLGSGDRRDSLDRELDDIRSERVVERLADPAMRVPKETGERDLARLTAEVDGAWEEHREERREG